MTSGIDHLLDLLKNKNIVFTYIHTGYGPYIDMNVNPKLLELFPDRMWEPDSPIRKVRNNIDSITTLTFTSLRKNFHTLLMGAENGYWQEVQSYLWQVARHKGIEYVL